MGAQNTWGTPCVSTFSALPAILGHSPARGRGCDLNSMEIITIHGISMNPEESLLGLMKS